MCRWRVLLFSRLPEREGTTPQRQSDNILLSTTHHFHLGSGRMITYLLRKKHELQQQSAYISGESLSENAHVVLPVSESLCMNHRYDKETITCTKML